MTKTQVWKLVKEYVKKADEIEEVKIDAEIGELTEADRAAGTDVPALTGRKFISITIYEKPKKEISK